MGNIGDLIVEKRKERGLTQAELGAMLGISGNAVSKWERGLSKPCDEHLYRLRCCTEVFANIQKFCPGRHGAP